MCHSALETICDKLLSIFAFNFNLRRYMKMSKLQAAQMYAASIMVGRCKLTL